MESALNLQNAQKEGHVAPPLSSAAHDVPVVSGPPVAISSKRRLNRGRRVGTVMVGSFDIAEGQRDFLEIAKRSGTDKVEGNYMLEGCLNQTKSCTRPGCANGACRTWGHFYNTMYQKPLGPYSTPGTAPFQFLEIGFYTGKGYDAYTEFMPAAEAHSMEISCLPEGEWPWSNSASKNIKYQTYRDERRLHCGNASNLEFLNQIWRNEMKRPDAPPLKMVVDDGSHLSAHMAASMFFWFPRIHPRGLFIMEDIQPIQDADKFRTQFLPQIMADLHFCGDPKWPDEPCFPTLQPLLASIHCEMHICIFERNDEPAIELDLVQSKMPGNALDLKKCKSLMR
jgi:hypothetical protein